MTGINNSLEVGNRGFILFFLESVLWLIIKVPLQYVSNKVNNSIKNVYHQIMMPIIFSEAIILLTNSFIPQFSNENLWYYCITYISFFYRKIGYDLKRNLENKLLILPFPGAIFLVIIATFSTIIIDINRSLSLFYGGSSLLIIVGGILDTFQI